MTETPISELVAKAQAGDRESFGRLAELYRERLEIQVRSRLGGKVRARLGVDDVVQETYTVAFESIGKLRYRDEESFYRWLGSIAEHLIWSSSQKKAWDQIHLAHDVAGEDTPPGKLLQRKERFERLEQALRGLPEDYRRVLTMARIEGRRVSEIAARMNRSEAAVHKLLARALSRLKQSFGDTESLGLPDRRLGESEGGGNE